MKSPLDGRRRSPPTATRRSSSSRSPATRSRPRTGSTRRSPPSPRSRPSTPSLVVEQFGGASADKAHQRDDQRRPRQGGDALAAGHADHPHDRVRLAGRGGRAAAASGSPSVLAALGLVAIPSQLFPLDGNLPAVILLIGLAVGRRLLALLPPARARGARRRARRARRARGRRRHLGPCGADLRPHRDRRDGRDVHQRRQGLHLLRRGHDPRGRDRDVRLADRAAGDARPGSATGSRRAGSRSSRRRRARSGESRVLDRGDRPRHAASVARRSSLAGGAAGGAGDPGARR